MYNQGKCANCPRSGAVFEKEADKICKLCKDKQKAAEQGKNGEDNQE